MKDELVNVKIPAALAERIEKLVKKGEYVSRADFVRQAIREKLAREEGVNPDLGLEVIG